MGKGRAASLPLLIITVGSLLLLSNLGNLPEGLWRRLLDLWPVVLILFGIDILSTNSDSRSAYYLAVLIEIAIIAGSVMLAWKYL